MRQAPCGRSSPGPADEHARSEVGREETGVCRGRSSSGSARARATARAEAIALAAEPPERERRGAVRARPRRDQRIVARRRVRQAREQRRLAQAQLGGGGPEVERGRGLDADGALPQRHAVQVLLENRLLVEVALEPERPEHLVHLAEPGPRDRAGGAEPAAW